MAEDGGGRLFCLAMERRRSPSFPSRAIARRRKIVDRHHCRAGPLVGPIALLKAVCGSLRPQGHPRDSAIGRLATLDPGLRRHRHESGHVPWSKLDTRARS